MKNLIELRESLKNERHPGWLLVQCAIESSDCPSFIASVAHRIAEAANEDELPSKSCVLQSVLEEE